MPKSGRHGGRDATIVGATRDWRFPPVSAKRFAFIPTGSSDRSVAADKTQKANAEQRGKK
jgi:hypothetical protein